MSDTVQKVKDKLSIVDVISPYVKLTRAGKNYKGLSPFNKEKTPSFYVNAERGSYYCFSSNQGGDIFTFIEKMEGVDFKEALKILAEKAGVEIVYEGKQDKGKADRLREAVAEAEGFYRQKLAGSPGEAYAKSRGLTEKTIADFGLGYAAPEWRQLYEHLSAKGYTNAELLAAGLIKEAEGKPGTYYDRFRDRLMFPLRDASGRTVGFTGRALSKEEQAKYLNSPETELFRKSALLYAMDRAKDAIRTRGFALLMEGQMDVLHAHQAGFENTVAVSGTALTPEHLAILKRYSDNLMLALDADRAGLAATEKHTHAALGAGLRVKAILLPDGKDPADILSTDAKDFTERVKRAKPVVEFFAEILRSREKDSHKLVIAAERILLPLISAIKSPLEREHFVGVVAQMLLMSPEAVRQGLGRVRPGEEDPASSGEPVAAQGRTSLHDTITAVAALYAGSPLEERVKAEYTRITEASLPSTPVPERVLFETGIQFGDAPGEDAADELLKRFERESLTVLYQDALRKLREAEQQGNTEGVREAEATCMTLMKRIATLT
ncbi:MAG: DNA primase [Candidatus Pacebacteria bacterium]|nr:DNA primase [Candidatus Paceibacterota bacterium]MBP9840670.1 DNA primase [Candidatus Paceibacterota bacterium]